jgi:hypothetical protein
MQWFMGMTKYIPYNLYLIRYLTLYACLDHGTYYKRYLKKLNNNNTAHFSYTNYSLNMNI